VSSGPPSRWSPRLRPCNPSLHCLDGGLPELHHHPHLKATSRLAGGCQPLRRRLRPPRGGDALQDQVVPQVPDRGAAKVPRGPGAAPPPAYLRRHEGQGGVAGLSLPAPPWGGSLSARPVALPATLPAGPAWFLLGRTALPSIRQMLDGILTPYVREAAGSSSPCPCVACASLMPQAATLPCWSSRTTTTPSLLLPSLPWLLLAGCV
jgi:hypothetical protein